MIFSPTLSVDADLAKAPDYAAWTRSRDRRRRHLGCRRGATPTKASISTIARSAPALERLRKLSAAGDVKGLLFVLNEGIHGNIDGMGHERLYQKARFGAPKG